jgi:hypothetical protein
MMNLKFGFEPWPVQATREADNSSKARRGIIVEGKLEAEHLPGRALRKRTRSAERRWGEEEVLR